MQPEQQQRIMGYFIEEAKDHLNTIEQGLLNLQSTLADQEMVNELFRAAHSVKGGAAMLGLNSIQRVSHRLEDFFKVLKDTPVTVDQKLEGLFLRVFDTLQELLEQLQGPFGLSEETANAAVAGVEPTFVELEQHLSALASSAAPAAAGVAAPQPMVSATSESSMLVFFRNDVPTKLREMLQLFKQSEAELESRQQLESICSELITAGEQFNLTDWCQLIGTARQAIAHPDNSYRTLAPVVIKDIKQAQDLVLTNRAAEIAPCAQLLELVPVTVAPALSVIDDDFADLLNSADAMEAAAIEFEPITSDTLSFEDELMDVGLPQTSSIGEGFSLTEDFAELPADLDPFAQQNGPEVGMAELNSLADLFEGEVPDLGATWQEEEILGEGTGELSANPDVAELDTTSDFSDLLFDGTESRVTSSPTVSDDLSDLFGDELLEEVPETGMGSTEVTPLALDDDLDDLLDFSLESEVENSEPDIFADPQPSAELTDTFDDFESADSSDLSNLMSDNLDLDLGETPAGELGNLNELFAGMEEDVLDSPSEVLSWPEESDSNYPDNLTQAGQVDLAGLEPDQQPDLTLGENSIVTDPWEEPSDLAPGLEEFTVSSEVGGLDPAVNLEDLPEFSDESLDDLLLDELVDPGMDDYAAASADFSSLLDSSDNSSPSQGPEDNLGLADLELIDDGLNLDQGFAAGADFDPFASDPFASIDESGEADLDLGLVDSNEISAQSLEFTDSSDLHGFSSSEAQVPDPWALDNSGTTLGDLNLDEITSEPEATGVEDFSLDMFEPSIENQDLAEDLLQSGLDSVDANDLGLGEGFDLGSEDFLGDLGETAGIESNDFGLEAFTQESSNTWLEVDTKDEAINWSESEDLLAEDLAAISPPNPVMTEDQSPASALFESDLDGMTAGLENDLFDQSPSSDNLFGDADAAFGDLDLSGFGEGKAIGSEAEVSLSEDLDLTDGLFAIGNSESQNEAVVANSELDDLLDFGGPEEGSEALLNQPDLFADTDAVEADLGLPAIEDSLFSEGGDFVDSGDLNPVDDLFDSGDSGLESESTLSAGSELDDLLEFNTSEAADFSSDIDDLFATPDEQFGDLELSDTPEEAVAIQSESLELEDGFLDLAGSNPAVNELSLTADTDLDGLFDADTTAEPVLSSEVAESFELGNELLDLGGFEEPADSLAASETLDFGEDLFGSEESSDTESDLFGAEAASGDEFLNFDATPVEVGDLDGLALDSSLDFDSSVPATDDLLFEDTGLQGLEQSLPDLDAGDLETGFDLNFDQGESDLLFSEGEAELTEGAMAFEPSDNALDDNALDLDDFLTSDSSGAEIDSGMDLDGLFDQPGAAEAEDFADLSDVSGQESSNFVELSDFDVMLAGDTADTTDGLSNLDDFLNQGTDLAGEESSLDMDSLFAEEASSTDEFAGLGDLLGEDTGNEFAEMENLLGAPESSTDEFSDLDSLLGDSTPAPIDEFSDLDNLLGDTGSSTDEFADLDSLLGDSSAATPADEFADLESLLSGGDTDSGAFSSVNDRLAGSAPASDATDFADLEALLQADASGTVGGSSGVTAAAATGGTDFDDLDKLLEDAEKTMGPPSTKTRGMAPQRRPNRSAFIEQTMRVPVKHLDNLSNLVGELVVNRNSLEQDQERLRQSLDNLLYQVQQLSDVGQRMQDLYERSLLESSLLASRQNYRHGSGGGHGSARDAGASTQTASSTGIEYDPLEMDRFTGFHSLSQEMIELIVRVRESASDIEFIVDETDQVTRMFRQVTTQLQEGLTRSRMVPFAQTADRLPRAVRDIAMRVGKQAELQIEGRETLIDKMILEQLYDPMTHLVNNAITHGIESPEIRRAAGKSPAGRITIRAFHQGNQTIISVSDDGAGIDVERVKAKALEKGLITPAEARSMSRLDVYDLLFHAGFSTKDQADDFAGRGVGMDVVRTSLSEIRGAINTDSTQGKGTTFTIRLPLTLSISKALCCISDRARIAFPMDGVEDMLDVPRERVQTNAEGQPCIPWRDSLLPLRPLSELLSYNRHLSRGNVYGGNQEDDIVSIVVLRSAGNFLALQVDQVLGEQEIVIKQLEGPVPKPVGVAGATVLGDGRIMPIADVLELIDLSMGRIRKDVSGSLWEQSGATVVQDAPAAKSEPTVLIVDDSITVRELLSMTFNKVGYRVEQARDGQEAWEKLRSGLPCDIVFCDIEMPRMDGLELLSRIQKDNNLNHLPIAMLTSRGADRHRQMAASLGASGYFTKPYLEEALLDAAQRMLKGEVLISSNG